MDAAHPPPPPPPSHHEAVQSPAPQVDFLILLFAGTPLKLRPRAKLNGAAADTRLSQPGKTKDIRTAPIMRCQAGPSVIVNYIYPARLERRHQAFRNIKRRPRTWTSPRRQSGNSIRATPRSGPSRGRLRDAG